MSGKNQESNGWGGKREGAGRKPETLSVRQVQEFLRAAKKKAEEHGKTLHEIVLDIAYDESTPNKDKLAAAKLFWDKSVVNITEGGDADRASGPAVYLPDQRPQLESIAGGKSDEAA